MQLNITVVFNLLNSLINSISKCMTFDVLKLSARLFDILFSISSNFWNINYIKVKQLFLFYIITLLLVNQY